MHDKFYLVKELAKNNKGYITTKEIVKLGISRETVSSYVKNKKIERVKQGVYILPEVFEDKMYSIQISSPKAIFSYETSLFLHGLTDRDPLRYVLTVPRGYNNPRLKEKNIIVHTTKREWYELGKTKKVTSGGHLVTCYDAERTLCDIIKTNAKIDISLITDAYKSYVVRSEIKINKVMEYAEKLGVSKQVRTYLEVLL